MIFQTIELEVEGSAGDAIARLREITKRRRWTRQRYLAGKVEENRFRMSLVHPLLGEATTPVVVGSIEESSGSTRIRARVRPATLIAFAVSVFGLVLLILPVILLIQEKMTDAVVVTVLFGSLVLLLTLIHSTNVPRAIHLLKEATNGAS